MWTCNILKFTRAEMLTDWMFNRAARAQILVNHPIQHITFMVQIQWLNWMTLKRYCNMRRLTGLLATPKSECTRDELPWELCGSFLEAKWFIAGSQVILYVWQQHRLHIHCEFHQLRGGGNYYYLHEDKTIYPFKNNVYNHSN